MATSSLFQVLGVAVSGLQTNQTLLTTTSRNIANANTPGYVVKKQSQVSNTSSGGVLPSAIQRIVDESLLAKQRTTTSNQNMNQTVQQALAQINQLTGDPAQGTSLGAQVTALANAFQDLSANPQDNANVQEVLNAATNLAATFRSQTQALQTLQTNANTAITNTIGTVNQQLSQIATINNQILQETGNGQDTTDLQDQRDQLVNQLSTNINVQTFIDNRGVLNVYTTSGALLASDFADTLSFSAATGNITAHEGVVTNIGGNLGAQQQVSQNIVPAVENQLDALARQIGGGFAGNAGFTALNPSMRLFTDNASLTPTNANPGVLYNGGAVSTNFASVIQVDPALLAATAATQSLVLRTGGTAAAPTGSQPTDVSAATAAQQYLTSTTVTFPAGASGFQAGSGQPPFTSLGLANQTLTLENAATAIAVQVGQAEASTQNQATQLTSLNTQIGQAIGTTSSVNLDQELSNTVVLQNAYAANAKVVTTTQSMLDILLGLIPGG